MTFGRDPNLPSTLARSPTLTYNHLIRKWKAKHEKYIQKSKERIQLQQEKSKRRLDKNITRTHPIYQIGDLIKWKNNNMLNKLEPSWKGLGTIIQLLVDNNL